MRCSRRRAAEADGHGPHAWPIRRLKPRALLQSSWRPPRYQRCPGGIRAPAGAHCEKSSASPAGTHWSLHQIWTNRCRTPVPDHTHRAILDVSFRLVSCVLIIALRSARYMRCSIQDIGQGRTKPHDLQEGLCKVFKQPEIHHMVGAVLIPDNLCLLCCCMK